MGQSQPVTIAKVNIVAKKYDETLEFYRLLGVNIPEVKGEPSETAMRLPSITATRRSRSIIRPWRRYTTQNGAGRRRRILSCLPHSYRHATQSTRPTRRSQVRATRAFRCPMTRSGEQDLRLSETQRATRLGSRVRWMKARDRGHPNGPRVRRTIGWPPQVLQPRFS